MGQAKIRGTFEQRQKEGVDKELKRQAEIDKIIAEREAMKTPEQRESDKKRKLLMASMFVFADSY